MVAVRMVAMRGPPGEWSTGVSGLTLYWFRSRPGVIRFFTAA